MLTKFLSRSMSLTVDQAQAAAATISEDGGSVGTTMVTWVSTPHFYQAGRLIALYVGQEPTEIEALEAVLRPQVAGG